jgi:hypothetical protein
MKRKFKISLIVFLLLAILNPIVLYYFKTGQFEVIEAFKDIKNLSFGIILAIIIAFIPLPFNKKNNN